MVFAAGDVRGAVLAENVALGSFLLGFSGRRDAGRPGYFGFCFQDYVINAGKTFRS
jgi:hypothetical protein